MEKGTITVYYRKEMAFPFEEIKVNMDDYAKVYEKTFDKFPGYKGEHDEVMLESLFELLNWVTGTTPEQIGFKHNGAKHTSMSVGDIVDIDGRMYICESFGWGKVA